MSRRLGTRLPVRAVPRSDDGAGEPILAVARDISVGGMLLETKASLALGTILDLRFTLPDGEGVAKAVGSVVRGSGETGGRTGIRFLSLEVNVRDRLHATLAPVPLEGTFARHEFL